MNQMASLQHPDLRANKLSQEAFGFCSNPYVADWLDRRSPSAFGRSSLPFLLQKMTAVRVVCNSDLELSGELVGFRPASKRALVGPFSGESDLFIQPPFNNVCAVFCFPRFQCLVIPTFGLDHFTCVRVFIDL